MGRQDAYVEAINHEGEGEISRVLFMGYKAEALAREYASWKNASRQPRLLFNHTKNVLAIREAPI